MNRKSNGRLKMLALMLCMVLAAVTVLAAAGCAKKAEEEKPFPTTVYKGGTAEAPAELGQGAKSFTFSVTYKDGKKDVFSVKTDKTTVGAALLELKIIAGEDSTYGLYVKRVNGEMLDFDADNMYWAFYMNGAYADTGVDTTDITDGAEYSFVATKG